MSKHKENSRNWLLIQQDAKKLFGSERVELSPKNVIVVVRVKDAAEYIIPFVNHYLKLGVKHLFFLDNGSTDDTLLLLKGFKQVTVFQTFLPYKTYKMAFFHFLLQRFGINCWSLVVDIDEFFDYPFSTFIPLSDLIKYLNQYQYQALVGQMLDLFPENLSLQDSPDKQECFLDEHIYYDLSNITKHVYHEVLRENKWTNYNIRVHRGGIRKKWFGLDSIVLTKFSLVRYSPDWHWESIHRAYPFKVADISAVLYHYKFRSDFKAFVEKAVAEENYNMESKYYKKILKYIQENKQITTITDQVQQHPKTTNLIKQDFLVTSGLYLQYICQHLNKQIVQSKSNLEEREKLLVYQQQLLQLAISKMTATDNVMAKIKRENHEELYMKINTLKNTWSWKLGNGIVKPLKKMTAWLRILKGSKT